MTKSQPSATKLRLSRLTRCLLVLCCVKLLILGSALFDMPARNDDAGQESAREQGQNQFAARAGNEVLGPAQTAADDNDTRPGQAKTELAASSLEQPQGSEAAELAAAAKPRKPLPQIQASLPAPLVPAGPASPLASSAASVIVAPLLPEPPALGAPLVQAGVIMPENKALPSAHEDSIWDILDLKSLPIPGLGSAQAAHAAALDMPVPPAPAQKSPFAPAEQMAPLNPKQPAPAPLPGATPQGRPLNAVNTPAPQIQPGRSALDPNAKAQELARQQQDILMLRQQMDQRLKDLQTAEDKMKDMIREAKELEDQKVRSLVQMYANMKPRTAAQALENMDERVAVRILSGMAPKQSGEILTYTNPVKTAKFTEMLTRMRIAE